MRSLILLVLIGLAGVLLGALGAATTAQAGICDDLWVQREVRNTIYKENGYCFHTQKAIDAFGNAGCKYDDSGAVPLNAAERHNVSAIKKVEAKKGC